MKVLAALLALMSGPVTSASEPWTPAGEGLPVDLMEASTVGSFWSLSPEQVAIWDELAACESGGRWDLNTGAFDGGLQWLPSTWRAWRGDGDPAFAHEASREQQIAAADRLRVYEVEQGRGGYGPWPGCARRLALAR